MSVPQLDNKFFPGFADWECGAWSGTKFFVLANYGNVLTSPTGIEGTWSSFSPAVSTIQMWFNGVDAVGDICVAVSNGFDGVSLRTTDGGATWANGTIPLKSWTCVATDGAGMWVALSEDMSGNILITSTNNGSTWTSRVGPGNSHGWQDVLWTGTKFVAISNDGYVSTSLDGITWTAAVSLLVTAGIKNIFRDPVTGRIYLNTGAGSTFDLYYSDDDAVSWSSVTPPFESFDNATGLYKDGVVIIRSPSPDTAYAADIATDPFDTGDNPLDFNPSTLIFGIASGIPTAIAIGRFTDEYLYGTGFQGAAVAVDDPFFHFTF
jgi:hypothetical protein